MTNKEIATRLRWVADLEVNWLVTKRRLHELADTLDPLKPKQGTFVWWRFNNHQSYQMGIVAEGGDGVIDSEQEFHEWMDIDYKPARILAPDEVAVKVPPVKKWGGIAELHIQVRSPQGGVTFSDRTIARAEAERMEAER